MAVAQTPLSPARRPRWLPRILLALLLVLVVLAGVIYCRPLTVLDAASVVLLRFYGIESRYVQLGPYRIHYLVGGKGEPLLLVHGLGGHALDWTPILVALAGNHRVFALDLLGFGDSDKPAVDYSIPLETGILRQFLESQNLTRVDLAGWSMGGWISLDYTRQYPQQVRRLILFDSAGMRFPLDFDRRILEPRNLDDLAGLMRTMGPHPLPAFLMPHILRRIQKQERVVHSALDSMLKGDDVLDGKLGSVTVPVLIVWGKQDTLTPLSIAQAMQREMPQARLEVFDGCGHAAPVACGRRVLPRILQFLSASPPLPPGTFDQP